MSAQPLKLPLPMQSWYFGDPGARPLPSTQEFSGGMDLPLGQAHVKLLPGESKTVGTGLFFDLMILAQSIDLPPYMELVGLIRPRSGLAAKHGIEIGAGVIDQSYQGEIRVVMRNLGKEPVTFTQGDRIAQMLIIPVISPSKLEFQIVEAFKTTTERGEKGFGSSGR